MKKKLLVPIVLMLVALTTLSFTAGNGIALRLRPIKGKTYVIISKTNQTTVMQVSGQTIRSTMNLDGRQTFSAEEVSSNQNVFETQIKGLKMTSSTMGMTFTYDSDHPENTSPMVAQQASIFDSIINKTNTMTYNELGQNTDSDDMEMSQLSNVIVELPEEELHVGSQWSYVKTQNVNDVDVNINMTYTVTSISKKSVDVSYTGTVDSKDVSGTYEGTASINPQTGFVVANNLSNTISMTVSEQGFDMQMTITGTTTITVKEQ